MIKRARPGVVLIVVFALFSGCATWSGKTYRVSQQVDSSRNSTIPQSDVTIHDQPEFGITILKVGGPIEFLYAPKGFRSLTSVAREKGYRFIVNGSYFDFVITGFEHAGWLSIDELKVTPVKQDRQLSCVVSYNTSTEKMEFQSLQAFQPSTERDCVKFQTGPTVIENSSITHAAIEASINGRGSHLRTLLGYDEDGYKYLLITRETVSLEDLAKVILAMDIFKDKSVNFVNLDGGSSVALYSSEHKALNYNDNARLPILLAVR